ncbi:LCP family protein [Patescibacteria group bacterium]
MSIVDLKIKKKKKKNTLKKGFIFPIIVGLFLLAGSMVLAKNGREWFDPISIVSTVAASNLKETDGRTNILLLGSDNRTSGDIQLNLTDSILLASIGRVEHDVILISLPRDLWVEDSRGAKSKINEVYANNKNYAMDSLTGGDALMQVVEDVLGVPIHYYAVINFELFKDVVDTLGGVQVNVERSFTDYWYPIEGKENAPLSERYETVTFEEGLTTMDGSIALKYVRSRKGTNGEDTDFARSERQQKVIAAIKTKALSLETLINPSKVKDLYDIYSQEVDTNITFGDTQSFYLLSQQINFDRVSSIVLDDRSAADEGGLLYSPIDRELYGGAYVLIPKTGDFSQLHAYVQRYLFSQN